MAEDDGLLLNLFSHGDGNEEVNQGRRDRKLKVKHSILNLAGRAQITIEPGSIASQAQEKLISRV